MFESFNHQKEYFSKVPTPSLFNAFITIDKLLLKGALEVFTWGYHRNPLDYPLSRVPFSLSSVDPILSNR